jgi:hypothetical protein
LIGRQHQFRGEAGLAKFRDCEQMTPSVFLRFARGGRIKRVEAFPGFRGRDQRTEYD